uniref:THAP-type domain-containing protein n=1 Tax=Caenorhabditis tropicalis TaxID=1561998 RepID=A0A1I7T815_9PELO
MDVSPIFKPYREYPNVRGNKQTMIQNSIGRQLPYIVNFRNTTCEVFDIGLGKITHAFVFPEGCELIDVDYFPTPDGKFGIIVGIEDRKLTWGSEHFLLGLTADADTPTMRVTHSLDVPSRITVVKTLYSINDMTEGRESGNLKLFHKLLQWPHVVAIGCKRSKCFLASLLPVDREMEIPEIRVAGKGLIDLMAAYVTDDIFTYTLEDGAFREYPTSGVYVSSVALMPRSRTLLVGLSMGGIISAALNSSNQMNLLDLRQERRIHSLTPLEPEDDPDKFEYFIVAVDGSVRHPITLELWRGSFLKDLPDDEKYDRPSYSCCLAHRIIFGERWLSVKTIVQERALDMAQRRRNDSSADSMLLNASQIFGCTVNRSNVFLAYEKRMAGGDNSNDAPKIVEAAIFDIDAWYYKRVPGRVTTDDTVLRQCPFMSCIKSDITAEEVNDIGILTLDSTDMYRFTSMISDADQLFYPSALAYDRVYVSQKTGKVWSDTVEGRLLYGQGGCTDTRGPNSVCKCILCDDWKKVEDMVTLRNPNSDAERAFLVDALVHSEKLVVKKALSTLAKANRSALICNIHFPDGMDPFSIIAERRIMYGVQTECVLCAHHNDCTAMIPFPGIGDERLRTKWINSMCREPWIYRYLTTRLEKRGRHYLCASHFNRNSLRYHAGLGLWRRAAACPVLSCTTEEERQEVWDLSKAQPPYHPLIIEEFDTEGFGPLDYDDVVNYIGQDQMREIENELNFHGRNEAYMRRETRRKTTGRGVYDDMPIIFGPDEIQEVQVDEVEEVVQEDCIIYENEHQLEEHEGLVVEEEVVVGEVE